MSLLDQLKSEVVLAVKARDSRRATALRFLISLIDKRALQLPSDGLTEAEVLNVLQKEMKNKVEDKATYTSANRMDLVAELDYEIEMLKVFLPSELSQEELKKGIEEIVGRVGNNFSQVMREAMAKYKGQVDGGVVSGMVKEILT